MSNLTCASAEATTVSSINGGGIYPPPHSPKKKRNQPGQIKNKKNLDFFFNLIQFFFLVWLILQET